MLVSVLGPLCDVCGWVGEKKREARPPPRPLRSLHRPSLFLSSLSLPSQPGPAVPDLLFDADDEAAHLEASLPTVHVGSASLPRGGPRAPPTLGARALAVVATAAAAAGVALPPALTAATAPPPATPPPPPPLAWHPATRRRLAAADGAGRVFVFDVPPPSPRGSRLPPPPSPSAVLTHEVATATGVTSLAWRPCAGGTLAAGTGAGVLVWRVPPPRPRGGGATTTLARGATATFLPSSAPVAGLSFSPCGRLLAVAEGGGGGLVAGPRGVTVWDVATAVPTRVAPGPTAGGGTRPPPTITVAWSPDGGRLAAVDGAGGVTVWEAGTWEVASWAPPAGSPTHGGAVGAAWSPSGDALVLALARGSGGSALAALAFVGPPPSLAAHALPLALPPPAAATPPTGFAWDPAAGRLAVAVAGDGASTRVALLAADAGPVLTPRGVGVATLPGGRDGDDDDAAARVTLAFAPDGGGSSGLLAVRSGPRRVSFVVVGA